MRHIICPYPRSILGIPQLDDLLESIRYPDEPQTPRRPEWTSSIAPTPEYSADEEEHDHAEDFSAENQAPDTQLTKTKPAIIELTSRQSAAGKTNLLYYLTALATLPHEVDGKQSAVVWIDNDGRFSASRLSQVLRHHLLQKSDTADNTERSGKITADSIVIQALTHVHVFRPQSSSQVLSILESLPSYLLNQTRHKSSFRPLGLLIIDSATAFYAQDRFDAEMARLDAPLQQAPAGKPGTSKTAAIITHLRDVQARFECAVLFTTTTNINSNNNVTILPKQFPRERSSTSRPPIADRPTPITPTTTNTPIVSPWTNFATLTLQLERVRVPQFAPQMTLEQCLHDAESRLEVVRRGRFVIGVVPKTVESKGKGKTKGMENVVLMINEDGVIVE